MNRFTIQTLRTALIATALGLAATAAQAADFRIDLPMTSQWGSTMLPAGHYSVTYSATSRALKLYGCGKTVNVLVTSAEENKPAAISHVDILGGTTMPTVSSLTSATTGQTYRLAVSREAREQIARAQTKQVQSVALNTPPNVGSR